MRKIETAMNRAIASRIDWSDGNTMVKFNEEDSASTVYLYGNKIAEIGDNYIRLFDGGNRSATTKSRLNSILSKNGLGDDRVYQKSGLWFVSITQPFELDSKRVLFTNGMLVE